MTALPYLKFYPGDWLSSATVRRMSPEARGLYWDLLAVAWQEGGLPADPSTLAGWLGLTPRRFKRIWSEIESCWVSDGNGGLVNPRQERERAEAEEIYEKRVRAGRQGGRPKSKRESTPQTTRKAHG